MRYETINPATEEIIDSYETMSQNEVLGIARQSHAAYLEWRDCPLQERLDLVSNLAGVIRANLEKHSRFMSIEMGKPITQSRAEVEKCALLCDVYVQKAEEWLAPERVEADGKEHRVIFQPLGVILSIMPWNFPYWQAMRFAVPGVIAGNTSLLKHASNVPQCAFGLEELFREAGFPPNIFRTILATHEAVSGLMADVAIQGISLTGSTGAGARIAETAGRNLKKVVLELGGSDPFIILEDADIEVVARNAVTGRMVSTGQSCIAAKRFIVMKNIADNFTARFSELMNDLVIGDPLDDKTDVGAIVDKKALDELLAQLDQSVKAGAKVVTGGKRLDRKGFFLEPTVVTDTRPEMRIVSEEVFGPIAPIIVVKDEEEAIRVANDSIFGLGGSVWTRDIDRGIRLAEQIEAGTTFINSIVKSDPRMPFGGIKRSGIGRELSKYGLREFVSIKGI
ncbi:MAG: NAD-dependent succinate-semialdehyde dehydrogenase, partial [Candidatus Eisenbacteria bacterium]|nr:NAD-dependent succinate-semialdehyde dehydrogenase [Candidatus Eisenbacteria bacterium]